MTISSVIALAGFADLGMGYGLLNAISEANGKDDRNAARKYISSAFILLSAVALVVEPCLRSPITCPLGPSV